MNRKTMWVISLIIAIVIVAIINIKYWKDDAQLAQEELHAIEYYVSVDNYAALNRMEIKSKGYELNYTLESCRAYATADFISENENWIGMLYNTCVKAITKVKGKFN